MKLWLRVAAVVAVVSVTSLMLTGVFAIRIAGETATRIAERAQERDAAAVAASVERWLADRRATLRGWAQTFPLGEVDDARRAGLTRAVLSAIPSAVVVALVDEDGQAVVPPAYFDVSNAPSGALVADEARARRLLEALPISTAWVEESAVGRPFVQDPLPSVPIAVVASEDPPLLLGAEIALDVVAELRARSSADHAVVLLDREGRVIDASPPPQLVHLLDVELIRALLGTVSSVAYRRDGILVQGALAPVAETGWTVVVLEPADVALEGPRRIRRLLPVVIGAVMVLAIVLAVVLARTITQPIARLRDQAMALAEGRLGVTTEVHRTDEVGELARAFNHMSERLRAHQEEIRAQREAIESFNLELQRRVEEATAELREAQEQLVRSGQLAAVAQITAGLAHELNNPLTAVFGLAQLLRSRDVPPEIEADLAMLEQEARRCREVVDTLLKIAGQGDADDRGPASLGAILDDVASLVAPGFGQRGVALRCGERPDLEVMVGRRSAAQALSQLLTGIASGLPRGASIGVTVHVEQRHAVVHLAPSQAVEAGDAWMASGIDVWVARQTLDRLGAELVEPLEPDAPWRVRFAFAADGGPLRGPVA